MNNCVYKEILKADKAGIQAACLPAAVQLYVLLPLTSR